MVNEVVKVEKMMGRFEKLLHQRSAIDEKLLKLQLRMVRDTAGKPKDKSESSGKKYTPRTSNKMTLEDAIRSVMVPGEPMSISDITEAVANSSYQTKSDYLYGMISNRLNNAEDIVKVGRGVFKINKKRGPKPQDSLATETTKASEPKKRGRKKGSKNKPKPVEVPVSAPEATEVPAEEPKKRGRKKGSKNKAKPEVVAKTGKKKAHSEASEAA